MAGGYARDSEGRITSVSTQRDSNAATVTLASNITWQPLVSNLTGLTYGNNFALTQTYTQDQVLDQVTLTNGATVLMDRTNSYDANLNVTALTDAADANQNQSYAYSPANRLTGSTGLFGRRDFEYDALGNRTARITERPGQTENRREYSYPVDSNRLIEIAKAGVAERTFSHDAMGNVLTDTRLGPDPDRLITYTYNQAGRLASSTIDGNLRAQFTYNARSQMAVRDRFNQTPSGVLHMLYDEAGQLLVETKDDGKIRREYIWLGDNHHLLAQVKGAWQAAPSIYYVHNDHQNRPLKMSDSAGQIVWSAVHWPFGKPFEVVKTKGLRLRFPGQWAIGGTGGLSYNGNRFYDPKTGRYTRPDPLGFVDGPSVYAYVGSNPLGFVDPDGRVKNRNRPGFLPKMFEGGGGGHGFGRGGGRRWCPPEPTKGTTAHVGARPDNRLEYQRLNQANKNASKDPRPRTTGEKATEAIRNISRAIGKMGDFF